MTVVDIRPDRFLRELRNHGQVAQAMEAAGLSVDDVNELLKDNRPFQVATMECIFEYYEEDIIKQMAELRARLQDLHDLEMKNVDELEAKSIKELRDGFYE